MALAATRPAENAPPRQGPMLAVLLSAWFMSQFDFFVVNVAAPSFQRELHAGPVALELIVGGYAFAYAAGMITGGRLGDLFGYRRMFVIGMVAFTLASLLCGVASDAAVLVAARLLQGLTAAMMVPQVLAVITAAYPPATRPRAVAWYGVAGGLGSIAGQVLGGLLLNADVLGLGWRVIFLINLPVGAVAAVLAWRMLPGIESDRRSRLDPLGAAGFAAALAMVLVPLALGRTEGWPAWVWISMALAVPVASLTLWWQRALAARGGAPVLDMSLFAVRSYAAGLAVGVAFMSYFGSFMFTLTLLLQGGLGFSALKAGLTFAPMGILFATTALTGRAIIKRYGLRVVFGGGVIVCASLALLALLSSSGHARLPAVVAALGLVGFGNGLFMPYIIGAALIHVRPHQAGIGSAVLNTALQFAGSAGVAIVGAVFFAVAAGHATVRTGYPHAMEWTTLIDLGLMVVAIALVGYHKYLSDRETVPA